MSSSVVTTTELMRSYVILCHFKFQDHGYRFPTHVVGPSDCGVMILPLHSYMNHTIKSCVSFFMGSYFEDRSVHLSSMRSVVCQRRTTTG